MEGQLLLINLLTDAYVECTAIGVIQCTVEVDSVNTETDDVALHVVGILHVDRTRVALEEVTLHIALITTAGVKLTIVYIVVTHILIDVVHPSVHLRRVGLLSKLLIERYIETSHRLRLVATLNE